MIQSFYKLKCLSLTILGLTCQVADSDISVCQMKDNAGQPKFIIYNTATDLCCNGTLSKKIVEGHHKACCLTDEENGTGETYFIDEKLCCGNSVVRKVDNRGQKVECCEGKTPYVPQPDGLCCNGEYQRAGEHTMCCNGKTYDARQKICCGGKILQRIHNQKCCGQKLYNVNSENCQINNEVLQVVPLFEGNCNGIKYHTWTQLCCQNVLHDISGGEYNETYGCCGSKLRHNHHKRCCHGHVIDKHFGCCGTNSNNAQAFDERDFKCERGVVLPIADPTRFCGRNNVKFDENNEQCCGDTVLSRSEKCCEGKKLPNDSICCPKSLKYQAEEKAIKKRKPTDNACCIFHRGLRIPYLDVQMKCINGEVWDKRIDICGEETYNKTRDLCCKGTALYPGRASNYTCCGNSFYYYPKGIDQSEAAKICRGEKTTLPPKPIIQIHKTNGPVVTDYRSGFEQIQGKSYLVILGLFLIRVMLMPS